MDVQEILKEVDQFLEGVVKRARMYASNHEALEFQVLCYLRFRTMVGRPSQLNTEEVRDSWEAFITKKVGYNYNSYLCVYYKDLEVEEFAKIIGEGIDFVKKRLPLEAPR